MSVLAKLRRKIRSFFIFSQETAYFYKFFRYNKVSVQDNNANYYREKDVE